VRAYQREGEAAQSFGQSSSAPYGHELGDVKVCSFGLPPPFGSCATFGGRPVSSGLP
jgi:hypothetical protein